jgi:hypothetical protein
MMSDAAITSIVTGMVTCVTVICGVITLWLKQRSISAKVDQGLAAIDDNTQLTKAGATAATVNTKVAANAAVDASRKADDLAKQFNGALDDRIKGIVKEQTDPLVKSFADHNEQYDRNMKSIQQAIDDLRKSLGK